MTAPYPAVLGTPIKFNPELRSLSISGGITLSGAERRVIHGAPRWEFSVQLALRTSAQILAYRAWITRLRQGENVMLPVYDKQRASNFGTPNGTSVGAAVKGAVVINAEILGTVSVSLGHRFSIGNNLYQILDNTPGGAGAPLGTILAITGGETWDDTDIWVDNLDFDLGLVISPPLRAAVSAGSTLNFNDLKCRCILKNVDEGDFDPQAMKTGVVSLTFVEEIAP